MFLFWVMFYIVLQNVKTFNDVKGCDEAKEELEEIVEYLKNPAKFTRLGGKLPKVNRISKWSIVINFAYYPCIFCQC